MIEVRRFPRFMGAMANVLLTPKRRQQTMSHRARCPFGSPKSFSIPITTPALCEATQARVDAAEEDAERD